MDGTTVVGDNKNYLVALALSVFGGSLGLDRFYLRKPGTAILKLITLGGLGIWYLIDVGLIAFGKTRAKNNDQPLDGYERWSTDLRGVVKAFLIIQVVGFVLTVVAFIVMVAVGVFAAQQGNQRLDDTLNGDSTQIQLPQDDMRGMYPDYPDAPSDYQIN